MLKSAGPAASAASAGRVRTGTDGVIGRHNPEEAAAYRPGFKWYFDWDGIGPARPACSTAAGVLLALALALAAAGCGEGDGAARPCTEFVLKSDLWHYELPETVAHGDTIALAATYVFGPSLCYGYDHTDLMLSGMGCTIAVWTVSRIAAEPARKWWHSRS